ncbi:E1-like protein-activating [Gongronella butleri]|nr:E1-like protein-activating [Gongronella butleri]
MNTLQFTPFQSAVDASFWLDLADKKLNVLGLSQAAQPLVASYALARDALPCLFTLPGQALDPTIATPPFSVRCDGVLHNTNTLEDYKKMDKTQLAKTLASDLWQAIVAGDATKTPSLLTPFTLLTFADLKKSRFYYWFAFPALVPTEPWVYDTNTSLEKAWTASRVSSLVSSYDQLQQPPFFRVETPSNDQAIVVPLSTAVHDDDIPLIFGFTDPSSSSDHPGWPARNLLAWIHHTYPGRRVQLLGYRERPADKVVAWERSEKRALAPRMVDLAHMMDPTLLASNAVDLNLKLMRWRLMPELDLDKIKATKCLLLGAGTLGCYVARSLMGWGVRHITFVDNGKVSLSNPVRQPLYRFDDSLRGGKEKASTAAARLLEIQPTLNARGISMTIPMPGHPQPKDELDRDLRQLDDLIAEHDVIFLLTDSRESRWLPTLLGAVKHKIVLNAALGFDSYVVMRHGTTRNGLGCYFCHDVVAPTDSLKDRTLDQQCTVTRPGLSAIAAALAVEMLVSLLQHKDGIEAEADTTGQPGSCVLGLVPHQIRGFLGQFNNMLIAGQAYDKCTACSKKVMDAYEHAPLDFLQQVTDDSLILERVTGLDEMKKESEALLLDADWALDEDDDF